MCFDALCFLSYSIYPRLHFPVSYLPPIGKKQKLFARHQEGARKALERVFEVSLKPYRILYMPCRLYNLREMERYLLCCIIMHNMTVEDRHHSITGTRKTRLPRFDTSQHEVLKLQSKEEAIAALPSVFASVENRDHGVRLKYALADSRYDHLFENSVVLTVLTKKVNECRSMHVSLKCVYTVFIKACDHSPLRS